MKVIPLGHMHSKGALFPEMVINIACQGKSRTPADMWISMQPLGCSTKAITTRVLQYL